jgi:hypothetical protein
VRQEEFVKFRVIFFSGRNFKSSPLSLLLWTQHPHTPKPLGSYLLPLSNEVSPAPPSVYEVFRPSHVTV